MCSGLSAVAISDEAQTKLFIKPESPLAFTKGLSIRLGVNIIQLPSSITMVSVMVNSMAIISAVYINRPAVVTVSVSRGVIINRSLFIINWRGCRWIINYMTVRIIRCTNI
jgi:hypothetical protein